ncbi:hypothetical protein WSM22_30840 [Cytophagales bacterium WSM2-2]|nr:hypothetical protein WSM22_30840 [Cytophagales bacterium WSM2-2]
MAQKNAIKFQVGYGIPLVNSVISTNVNFSQAAGSPATHSNVNGSFGSGLRFEVGYVRSFSSLVSFQFDATYLMGNEIKANQFYENWSYSSIHFIQFSPQVRIAFGSSRVRPYGSLGPVLGIGSFRENTHLGDTSFDDSEYVYNGSAALGAKTTMGIEIASGKLSLYAEISMVNMNYAPSRSELVKYNSNGTDRLGTLTVAQKQVEYRDSYTDMPAGVQNPNQPSVKLKQYYPFSSLSFSVGVMFKF